MTVRMLLVSASLGLAACGPADGQGNAAALAQGTAAATRTSLFTQLDDKACGKENVLEETGDWDRRCAGAGGYALEWSSGDLREDLTLIKQGKTTDLDIPTKVSGGAFDSLSKTIEWRGPAGGAPDVLVVRVHVVVNVEGKSDGGRLTLVRLGTAPCIVAVIPPGPGQSDRARAIADVKLPDCLKD